MKLFAIVDKDGNIFCCASTEPIAWEFYSYGWKRSPIHNMRCIELHTYDPSKQVVVDRDVYNYVREYAKFHSDPFSDQFLKAGESAL